MMEVFFFGFFSVMQSDLDASVRVCVCVFCMLEHVFTHR